MNEELQLTPVEMIRFICPRCRKRLKAHTRDAGKRTKCVRCGQHTRIPSSAVELDSSACAPSENSTWNNNELIRKFRMAADRLGFYAIALGVVIIVVLAVIAPVMDFVGVFPGALGQVLWGLNVLFGGLWVVAGIMVCAKNIEGIYATLVLAYLKLAGNAACSVLCLLGGHWSLSFAFGCGMLLAWWLARLAHNARSLAHEMMEAKVSLRARPTEIQGLKRRNDRTTELTRSIT